MLNNRTYEDNRIPPRGFSNTAYGSFGGAPVGHSYADGQYGTTHFTRCPREPPRRGATLYQSTSKEFVEFLRDENTTNTKGRNLTFGITTANVANLMGRRNG